jgi:hypothetical protein
MNPKDRPKICIAKQITVTLVFNPRTGAHRLESIAAEGMNFYPESIPLFMTGADEISPRIDTIGSTFVEVDYKKVSDRAELCGHDVYRTLKYDRLGSDIRHYHK